MTTDTMTKFLAASDELEAISREASFLLADKGFDDFYMHDMAQSEIDNDPALSELNERMNAILDSYREAERELTEPFALADLRAS